MIPLGYRRPTARFTKPKHKLGKSIVLDLDNPSVVEMRSLHPEKVRVPTDDDRVLKPGSNNYKLGSHIIKGLWKHFPIFALALEERRTCPSSCARLLDCFGNHGSYQHRFTYGPELIRRIDSELELLALEYSQGFCLRLHQLGDFPSVEDVGLWSDRFDRLDPLHIFGFTHWHPGTPIGDAIAELKQREPKRFRMRWSDWHGEDFPP